MVEVSTSLLNVKKEDILGCIYNLEVAKTDYFHIDVMDGKFVEKNTTEMMHEYSSRIKNISNLPLDVHLMVNDPLKYINELENMNISYITFHLEIKKDIKKIIDRIKELGYKVGISIKPNTDIEKLRPYLDDVDMILVMTVEPGFSGQGFMDMSDKENLRFLDVATGSLAELETQLIISKNLGFIESEDLIQKLHPIAQMLSGLKRHLKQKDINY